MVRAFRTGDDATPIVLMGYYNPIYIYGVDRFLADAKAAGVDGLIVVDLPPEEDDELCLPALKAGLSFIRLATPTTDDRRLPAVLANTSGFVYYVSITGITGAATPDPSQVNAAVARIKRHTRLPVAVGFGVRTAEHAARDRGRRRRRGGRLGTGERAQGQPRQGQQGDGQDPDGGGQPGRRARQGRARRQATGGGVASKMLYSLAS